MKRLVFLCLPFFLVFSCAGSNGIGPVSDGSKPSSATVLQGGGEKIKVDNPTVYNVYFQNGQLVQKKSSGNTVELLIEDATLTGGFDILYEIPLSNTVALFCKGDHRTIRENQASFIVAEPRIDEIYGTYISITNRASNAISFYTGGTANPSWEQRGSPTAGNNLARTDKREFSPNETVVFDISRDSAYDSFFIRDSRRDIPLILPQDVKRNYIYKFEYANNSVILTDVRPLQRAGEEAWTKTISDAIGTMPLVTAGGDIHLLVPGKGGLFCYDFDSAGNGKTPVQFGESMEITAVMQSGGGFFMAGYTIEGAYNRPIVRIHGADGNVQRMMAPSTRSEYRSAYFNTAAHKDGAWLAAGGADRGTALADAIPAYVRLLRDDNSLTVEWERGKAEFDAALKANTQTSSDDLICGEVRSVVYDSVHDRWLLTGKNLQFDSMRRPVTGSYIAVINGAGVIQKIDTSFRGMSFYKLLTDIDGNYYAAGEEERGTETYAVVIKYNAEGRQIWRAAAQPASHSYYQDAVLDADNGQIVLAGTMSARTESGSGGTPFIEGRNLEKGDVIWNEKLTDRALSGTSLVTSIVPAPDYGFALTLSGIADYPTNPFMVARVNARGKINK